MSLKINSLKQYQDQVELAKSDHDKFWSMIANEFFWFKKWRKTYQGNFTGGDNRWFVGGKTNITSNIFDSKIDLIKNQIAIYFEPNQISGRTQEITYQELFEQVCKFANLLKSQGIKQGDRVCIYMPMIPESVIAMLACARIGAVHNVVFAGFSVSSLADRIKDSEAKIVITADYLYRGPKALKIIDTVNEALGQNCDSVNSIILFKRSNHVPSSKTNLLIWQDEIAKQSPNCPAKELDCEDPLFILYTSGSTGKPKGILHSTAGYMVYTRYSFENVFNYQDGDIFFCTADIGWITGHSYLTYGPLLSGASIVIFEGMPTHPAPDRLWQIIEKYQVNIFYTAPTAIRALMQKGDQFPEKYQLKSLKTLGTVGEPINQEAWQWYHDQVGKGKCAIIDSWWQTETGGILISPLAHLTESIPTFATKPLPGIEPILLDENNQEITQSNKQGNLCIKSPWPSILRNVWGDNQRLIDTYFTPHPNHYFSGDGAFKDGDGNYRVIGRIDDVINVSGHRIGTAEIENAINQHNQIIESAVIGYPHKIKGESIQAFIITKSSRDLGQEVNQLIVSKIGPFAKPERIIQVRDLPKTRSGKIMRRILKKIIADEDLGDISTLVNPEIVQHLKEVLN